jgi:uncharacterized protein (UPF0332 family)
MRKPSFLHRLHDEGKLALDEPSEEICQSYLEKAMNCLKSAQVLLENKLWENSVTLSYYAMYNSLLALLFKSGIKSENHAASIRFLRDIFHQSELYNVISFAKKERIDKQYYIDFELTKESAQDLIVKAEDFLLSIKGVIKNLNN